MMRLSWMSGPAPTGGSAFVSATSFTYRSKVQLPVVFWHGLRLRRGWSAVDGALGMYTGASVSRRTTYTVSAWVGPEALQRWLASPAHLELMRDFKAQLVGATSLSWRAERFEPRAAWRDAMARLAQSAMSGELTGARS